MDGVVGQPFSRVDQAPIRSYNNLSPELPGATGKKEKIAEDFLAREVPAPSRVGRLLR